MTMSKDKIPVYDDNTDKRIGYVDRKELLKAMNGVTSMVIARGGAGGNGGGIGPVGSAGTPGVGGAGGNVNIVHTDQPTINSYQRDVAEQDARFRNQRNIRGRW